jgi:hypothetical protein
VQEGHAQASGGGGRQGKPAAGSGRASATPCRGGHEARRTQQRRDHALPGAAKRIIIIIYHKNKHFFLFPFSTSSSLFQPGLSLVLRLLRAL